MNKHIIFLHVRKAIDHTVLLAPSYFRKFVCCRLMNTFLTQFWTLNLLIHNPQPRPNAHNFVNSDPPWLSTVDVWNQPARTQTSRKWWNVWQAPSGTCHLIVLAPLSLSHDGHFIGCHCTVTYGYNILFISCVTNNILTKSKLNRISTLDQAFWQNRRVRWQGVDITVPRKRNTHTCS